MKRHALVLFAGLLAFLASGGNAQTLTNSLSVEVNAGTSEFLNLETAAFIQACSQIAKSSTNYYSIRDYINVERNTAYGVGSPTATALVQYKIDCLHRLIDPDMLCNVDSLDPAATTCTAYYKGSPYIMILDTLHFKCEGFFDNDGTSFSGCPLEGGASTDFKGLSNINYATNADLCNADYEVLGFDLCEQSALCAYKAVATSMSYGPYCPNQLNGKMCCGQTAARLSSVDFNTIDMFNNGDGIKPGVSHVVDLDVDIQYTISDPARLKVDITVPYVTTDSYINITVGSSEYAYKMCPSTYLIDMKDPLEGRPLLTRIREPAVRGSGAAASDWLPLKYLPKADAAGTPRSSCGNYDFNVDSGASVQKMRAYLSYPGSTASIDSSTYESVFYGDTPTYNGAVWPTYIADASDPANEGLVPGKKLAGGTRHPFFLKGTPSAGKITYSMGAWDVVRGWGRCQATADGNAKLVTKSSETDGHVVNGVSYDVDSYSWTWHVCRFGRYGENCGDNDASIITYAKSCARYPATFSLSPQQIADVTVNPINATVTAKVFLQSVIGSGNVQSGCAAGFERFVITMNLVYFETASDSVLITDEAVHDLVSPSSMFSGVTSELSLTPVISPDVNDVRAFLTAQRGTSAGIVQGIFTLQEEDYTIDSQNPYRYQKVILVTKCYDTKFDSTRGTRGAPQVFADAHKDPAAGSIMLETQLIAENAAATKRTALNLRILASEESFHLPTAEVMEAKEIQATQTVYGSYENARAGLNEVSETVVLRPDAQLCSKHQIDQSHAATAHLTPNSVGACILQTTDQSVTSQGTRLKLSKISRARPSSTSPSACAACRRTRSAASTTGSTRRGSRTTRATRELTFPRVAPRLSTEERYTCIRASRRE